MGLDRANGARGRARATAAALLASAVLVLLVVAPATAARGPVRLASPSVSPITVTAGQRITFSVVYSNGQGNGPASIVVKVGSTSYPMSAPSGSTNYGGGVTYAVVASPPAGTWTVTFIATDKFGYVATLDGSSVTVVAPPPPPSPPTPAPSSGSGSGGSTGGSGGSGGSTGGSGGTSGSVGSAGSAGAVGSGSGDGGSAADPGSASSSSAGTGSGAGPASGFVWGTPQQLDDILPPRYGLSAAAGAMADAALDAGVGTRSRDGIRASVGDVAGAPGPATGSTARDGIGGSPKSAGAGGPVAASAVLPGFGGGLPIGQLLTTMVVTLGGVAMAMSFMLFGRRRRDDPTDTDEALASAAATGPGMVAAGSLVAGIGGRPAAVAGSDLELDLPRWRRPSLLAARKEDPLRVVRTDVKLTFDHGAVAPIDGVERRLIRYRLVRLLDAPDELTAAELGLLDEGDEVQLIQRSGAYWLVLCPDGRRGWVHRMVLGDVVSDEDAPEPGAMDRPGSPAMPAERSAARGGALTGIRLDPQSTTAWSLQGAAATDAGSDIDEDVLRAYIASRRGR